MSIFGQYNSNAADIGDENIAAKSNPLEVGRLFRHMLVDGVIVGDPEWDIAPMKPIIDLMTDYDEFGTTFDYMPDKMSFELYGTHELWPILLWINGYRSRAEFRGPRLRYITAGYTGRLLDIFATARRTALAADERGMPDLIDLTVKKVYT